MNAEELKASKLILDLGVSIPLRPLRFFNLKKKPRHITIGQPYGGGLIRISNLWLKLGVSHAAMKDYTVEQNIEFIAKHGKVVSHIVASAIVRGYFTYKLFGRLAAWWLRWRVHPVFLSEAMYQLMDNIDIRPFSNIIKLAEAINPMKPRLSH